MMEDVIGMFSILHFSSKQTLQGIAVLNPNCGVNRPDIMFNLSLVIFSSGSSIFYDVCWVICVPVLDAFFVGGMLVNY